MLSRERQAIRAGRRIYTVRHKGLEEMMTVVVKELLALGGLYVKFAQLLLLNRMFAKSVPASIHRQVFDRVEVPAGTRIQDYLDNEHLRILTSSMRYISDQPMYAGSFAAVFEGELTNGRKVVIKVLRPGLKRTLKRDLRLLSYIARPVMLFNEEIKYALTNAMATFRSATLREIDYRQEIKNAEVLASTFKTDKYIYIPETFTKLSSPICIVQEKLEGVWLSDVLERKLKRQQSVEYVYNQTGSNLYDQLYNLGTASLYHTLAGDVVHGDPHPGNIVLMRDNQVGLIDFGITAAPIDNRLALLEYIKQQIEGLQGRTDIARLMITILRFHANYLYRAISTLSELYNRPLLTEMYNLLTKELVVYQDQMNMSQFKESDYSNALASSINKNNRFGLVPKLDNPLTQKAFIALWRANQDLDMEELTLHVFKDTVTKIEANTNVHLDKEDTMSVNGAFQVIADWLMLISEKDPKLFMQMQELFTPKIT